MTRSQPDGCPVPAKVIEQRCGRMRGLWQGCELMSAAHAHADVKETVLAAPCRHLLRQFTELVRQELYHTNWDRRAPVRGLWGRDGKRGGTRGREGLGRRLPVRPRWFWVGYGQSCDAGGPPRGSNAEVAVTLRRRVTLGGRHIHAVRLPPSIGAGPGGGPKSYTVAPPLWDGGHRRLPLVIRGGTRHLRRRGALPRGLARGGPWRGRGWCGGTSPASAATARSAPKTVPAVQSAAACILACLLRQPAPPIGAAKRLRSKAPSLQG